MTACHLRPYLSHYAARIALRMGSTRRYTSKQMRSLITWCPVHHAWHVAEDA